MDLLKDGGDVFMEEKLEKEHPQVTMLDPFKIWKKLYFSTEDILTSTMRNYVTTDEFANGIDIILNSYLQYLKVQNEFTNRYMEDSPFSSKRDVARVAELVVSLENKVDGLEGEIEEKLDQLENHIGLISQAVAARREAAAVEDLNEALTPSMVALKDLSKRVTNLEKILKKVDTNLSTLSKLIKTDAKKRTPVARAQRPKSSTELTE